LVHLAPSSVDFIFTQDSDKNRGFFEKISRIFYRGWNFILHKTNRILGTFFLSLVLDEPEASNKDWHIQWWQAHLSAVTGFSLDTIITV
jgi:hypothetical protein